MFKLKEIIKRTKEEINYIRKLNWSFKDIGEFWDTVDDYDEIDDETYAYKRRFYDSIRMACIDDKKRFLDIDCRTGNGVVFYNKNGLIKNAICVSPSHNFHNVCKKRLKKYNVKAKTLLLRKLPLELKSKDFDVILCLETIEHIAPSQRLEFLNELNRLLKDNGKMIFSMPSLVWDPIHWFVAIFGIHHSEGPHKFLSMREIRKLLKQSNFNITKYETTVLIPIGPRWLTKVGEKLEKLFKHSLLHLIGLRKIFICKKSNCVKN